VGCLSHELAWALASGAASGDEADEARAHLDACPDCLRWVSTLAALTGTGDEAPSAAEAPLPLSGRYRFGAFLGAGAMGVVFAARDLELDRDVAIKLLEGGLDAESLARARREARAMARVRHPNVVAVHDVGELDDRLMVVMERIDGGTLAERAADPDVDWRARLRLCVDAGRGLAAIHAAGLVHRDVKPSNILCDRGGRARIADFGLARRAPGQGSGEWPSLTATGAVAGTPRYMAPEQLDGVADARSDQYGLCVTTYELLCGHLPSATGVSPPPSVPRAVLAVLRRGLDVDPSRRFADVNAMLAALERAARGRRRGVVVLAVAGLVLAVAGGSAIAVARRAGSWPRAAGAADAGLADAGPPDAGAPDAAPPDAGAPDAGAPDAAPSPPIHRRRMGPPAPGNDPLAAIPVDLRDQFAVETVGTTVDGRPGRVARPLTLTAGAYSRATGSLAAAAVFERRKDRFGACRSYRMAEKNALELERLSPVHGRELLVRARVGLARCSAE